MPEASPFWQNAFLLFVGLALAWGVWSGWREGVVRAVVRLAALTGGGFVGLAVGGALAPLVSAVLPVPAPLVALVLALVIAIGVYAVAWLLSALLFKRTAQQPSALLRLVFGGGGAVVGAVIGLTLVWAALLGVRGLGGFYQGILEGRPPADLRPGGFALGLVKLKRSIEAGGPAAHVLAWDIVPEGTYRLLEKSGRVFAQPRAVERLLGYPPIQELLNDPKLVAITTDPDTVDAVRDQSLAALLTNPALAAAANDPALIARVRQLDIEAALDYALARPKPAPAPPSAP